MQFRSDGSLRTARLVGWLAAWLFWLTAAPANLWAQAAIGSLELRPFVVGIVPVVGPRGAVGGVSVDSRGVLGRADIDTLGRLHDARKRAMQPLAADEKVLRCHRRGKRRLIARRTTTPDRSSGIRVEAVDPSAALLRSDDIDSLTLHCGRAEERFALTSEGPIHTGLHRTVGLCGATAPL